MFALPDALSARMESCEPQEIAQKLKNTERILIAKVCQLLRNAL
jgi:hypothetical protein